MHYYPKTNLCTRTNKNCTLQHFYEYKPVYNLQKQMAEQICKYVLCEYSNRSI